MQRTAIIGGSGLYQMDGIEVLDELDIDTPYGKPSDTLT
ncbi:MAG: S-methyl-5'-thioadenosine phosphorylase, partial [Ghiorsea sp.]|nr:S-methyl-5'-thioadenosine phosphorylase [Ghiorsea sp.]